MKKVLIISPNFPPVSAVDMHRVRQSVTYFKTFGWCPTVVVVDSIYTEAVIDPILTETIPQNLEILKVKALSTRWTRKIGLGSLALRSLWFYFKEVNKLLKKYKFNLIYFSTTSFPITILGSYWKKRFKIPYVIDMQDPWHSDHYIKLPVKQRPPKFWFSYRLDKYLEPIAMKQVNGIIAVSQGYCDMLCKRYANIQPENCIVIPFGAFVRDFDILKDKRMSNHFFSSVDGLIHIVYVGVCHNMNTSINLFVKAFAMGLNKDKSIFEKVRLHFIGTSYAPGDQGNPSILPIAIKEGVHEYVQEHPARVSYFEAINLLKEAHMLLMLGTDDKHYTASKLYSYIMSSKPILAVFNQSSSVVQILNDTRAGNAIVFNEESDLTILTEELYLIWLQMLKKLPFTPDTNWKAFEPYSAQEMTKKQVIFFDKILNTQS